jgi:catechol 2,3-dioxygenase-like lactoylglutathione lyase family enzyme
MVKITGAHAVIYSRDPEADRGFLKDVLGFPFVDAGHGWLVFALPPAEVALHPARENGTHELYLMVDDLGEFVSAMAACGVACGETRDLRWGILTQVTLPGGGQLGVYEPRHERPTRRAGRGSRRRPATRKKPVGTAGRRRKRRG